MKIYIGNLSYKATEAEIREYLSECGEIKELFYPLDSQTNQPRGFAFATFADRQSAEEAINRLDGVEFLGRKLRVNEAIEKRRR